MIWVVSRLFVKLPDDIPLVRVDDNAPILPQGSPKVVYFHDIGAWEMFFKYVSWRIAWTPDRAHFYGTIGPPLNNHVIGLRGAPSCGTVVDHCDPEQVQRLVRYLRLLLNQYDDLTGVVGI